MSKEKKEEIQIAQPPNQDSPLYKNRSQQSKDSPLPKKQGTTIKPFNSQTLKWTCNPISQGISSKHSWLSS